MPSRTRREVLALLAAASVLLSTIELLIPKPLPFLRIGLANLPILVGLTVLPTSAVLALAALKVIGQGMVNGTLFSYVILLSGAGGCASVLLMLAAQRLFGRRVSLIGTSVLGALGSNLVQLLLASLIAFGSGALLIGPPFLIAGLVSSIALGALAERFRRRSRWLESVREAMGADDG